MQINADSRPKSWPFEEYNGKICQLLLADDDDVKVRKFYLGSL